MRTRRMTTTTTTTKEDEAGLAKRGTRDPQLQPGP